MGFRSWILVGAVMIWACGDDTAAGGDTNGTTMSPSSSDPSTTAPETTASTDATTASSTDATTTSTDTSASSSDATTASTTGDTGSSSAADTSSSESSGESGQGNVQYRAVALIGGLNRVRVMKRNDDDDTCTYVSLVEPAFKGMFGDVDVTDPWGVEYAGITDSAAACDSDNPVMFGGSAATDGQGTVGLENVGMAAIPCVVDIDVTFTFDDAIPALPDTDDMNATDIPVQGC